MYIAMQQELVGASTPGATTQSSLQLIGTGGTASILARMEAQITDYNRTRIESTRLKLDRVRWHVDRMWAVELEERKKIVGLPPNRADVILTGSTIYRAVMEHFKFEELRVSTRGLRFAAVMNTVEK
jgi:exopolyphosphatase/guanosine-5'-triphosphate,3'-diphosphate pyrophosphatase